MEILEASDHVVVQRGSLLGPSVATLSDNTHGEVLALELEEGSLDADHWGRTEEALLAAIRLLGHRCMEADNSRHTHNTCVVHHEILAKGFPNFALLGFVAILVELALA